jgi:hypothetical protein
LNTPEGQQVRNASGEIIKATEASRTNVSDGSLRDRTKSKAVQDNSIEIMGMAGIASSRTNKLSEKDLAAKEAQALVQEFGRVTNMPAGPQRDADLVRVQQLADKAYERGEYASKSRTEDIEARPIRDYGWQAKQSGQEQVIETGVAYEVGKPAQLTEQNLFERIGALPLDQQAQVIGAGIKAFNEELTHQQFRISAGGQPNAYQLP